MAKHCANPEAANAPKAGHSHFRDRFPRSGTARLNRKIPPRSSARPPAVPNASAQHSVQPNMYSSISTTLSTGERYAAARSVSGCVDATDAPIPYQEVRQEIFEQAMRVIPKAFIKTIITPYLEPLVSPRYLENYLKKGLELRPDLNIGINTNGSHLTREIAARLVDWQLKYINISLNLCDRDSYTWFTGKDFFDRVCEGIKLLYLERLRKRSKYPQIIVQFLNIPPVLGNEDALRAYWLQYADAVFFRNVSVPSALPDRVEKMKQELGEEFMEYEVELPRGWPCLSLFSTCSIDYEGNYIPCCPGMRASASVASGNEKSLVSSLVIGNIFEKDIATVWQGEELRRVRAMQVAGLLPICNTCRVNQANHKDLLNLRNAFYSHYYGETLA